METVKEIYCSKCGVWIATVHLDENGDATYGVCSSDFVAIDAPCRECQEDNDETSNA